MLRWLKSIFAEDRPARTGGRRVVRARYDAAQTSDDNRRYWASADALSANAAISPSVRRILRNRSRYEVANNSWANGIVQTLANDGVGTGPRLQMLSGDAEANRQVEKLFVLWTEAVGLAHKLRILRMARAVAGEGFALLTSNPLLPTPIKLDVRLIEADQVASPATNPAATSSVDGIVFDAYGNPAEYHVLKQHPGSGLGGNLDFDRIPAAAMIHYYRPERPGQSRGIPDITPALPLFAMLRRYNHAVLGAAETAASYAAVIYTDAPANGEAAEADAPGESFELEHRMATVLPEGWKLGQVHAEHPSTTHSEFTKNVLNEIARCLNMPFNVAAGNSSGYNYSSGRLDHQTYYKSLRVDQSQMGRTVLDPIFAAWLAEAILIEGYLPQSFRMKEADLEHQWFWDGMEHVDPAKEANAQATRLTSHTTTLAYEYARQGRDWEAELRQRAKELSLMRELGLSADPAAPPAPQEDEVDQTEKETADDE